MTNSHKREEVSSRRKPDDTICYKKFLSARENLPVLHLAWDGDRGATGPTGGSRGSGKARPTFPSLGYRWPREVGRQPRPASPFSPGRGGARAGPLRPQRRARRHHQPAPPTARLPARSLGTHRPLAAALSATEPRSHRQAPGTARPGRGSLAESPGPSKQEPRPPHAAGHAGKAARLALPPPRTRP